MAEKKMTFEEKMKRLDGIVSKIEGEELPLQETLSLYQEGKKLIRELQSELKEAEEKVGDIMVSENDLK